MIEFDRVLSDEQAIKFQGKILEYSCMTHFNNPTFGEFPGWRGALQDAYFSATFVGGALEVSVSENEFLLGDSTTTVHYANAKSLTDLNEKIKGMHQGPAWISKMKYYKTISQKEQKEITLDDIMTSMDWRYAQFAKVDENIVNEVCLSSFLF